MAEKDPHFRLLIVTPERVLFEGEAGSLVLPGEGGVFEILAFHKKILSRLLSGHIIINQKESFQIRRGVVKAASNEVVLIVEEALEVAG